MMGVAQALISIFAQDDDRPRTILRGRTRTTFVLKPPLYLFAVSDWGEPDYVVSLQLCAFLTAASHAPGVHQSADPVGRVGGTTLARLPAPKQL